MTAIATFVAAGFQAGIAGLLAESLRRGNIAAAVNAAASLAAALAPYGLALLLGPAVADPVLAVWVAVAGFLHAVGMLGPYESVWWWDHITHTVSAGLVAALVYAALLSWVALPSTPAGILAVATVLGLGVVWELLELLARVMGDRYGIEPVLVHYGWRDTALDLLFDAIGVLAVVGMDLRTFVPIVERLTAVIG